MKSCPRPTLSPLHDAAAYALLSALTCCVDLVRLGRYAEAEHAVVYAASLLRQVDDVEVGLRACVPVSYTHLTLPTNREV